MKNKKSLLTNTAYLLNSWFGEENGKLWASMEEFLREHHEEGWKDGKSKFIRVTFEVEDDRI